MAPIPAMPLQHLLTSSLALNLVIVAGACTTSGSSAPTAGENNNILSSEEQADGWRLLFDGITTSGWRAFRGGDAPAAWQVRDGVLAVTVPGGGDIITVEQFRNFDLRVQWRVPPGGNSGIFYRVTEAVDVIWHAAPEMQVLDDARHRDGRSTLTSAGALYALYRAQRGVVRAAGEWNDARIVLDDTRGEHWLNGVKLFEFEIGSPDWNRRVRASKFADMPQFGRAGQGHIGLQAHGDPVDLVEYRNIKIRVLP